MKTKCVFFLGMIISFFLSACDNTGANRNREGITHLAYQETENGKWGFVTTEGKIVVQPTFHGMPTSVTDDMFFVPRQNGTYELHNINEPEKIIDVNYTSVGAFYGGLAPVIKQGENISYINKQGEKVFELPNEIIQASSFQDGLAVVINEDDQFGFINMQGKIIIPLQYRFASPHQRGYALVMNDKKDIYYINKKGEKVYTITDANGENEDYIGNTFEIWINGIYENLVPYVTSEGTWGVKNINGQILVQANDEYKLTFITEKGYPIFVTNQGFGIMNKNGEIVIKDKYERITYCNGNFFIAKQGNEYTLLSMNETKLIPQTFTQISSINENCIYGIYNGKSILLNKDCKILGEYSMLSYKISMWAQRY